MTLSNETLSAWGSEDAYRVFLEAKAPIAQAAGLPCSLDDVPTHLTTGDEIKPHQRAIVRWAVEGGRRALFEAFGLGKSIQQLLICDIILRKVFERDQVERLGLIVCPLGVRREFLADAAKLGIPIVFVRSDAEIDAALDTCGVIPLFLTNYESVRDGKITVSRFTVCSLDEASVLRSYGSKTFQEFLPLFETVPYRFVATATPSPNRYKELIHYAGFLGVMDTGQALTRFFQRNSEKANDLNLYPHKEDEFWLWMNSWAVFLQRPSDLGFSDEGYDLPPIDVRWHKVETDLTEGRETDSRGQVALFRDNAIGVVGASREKRRTIDTRIAKVMELVRAGPQGSPEAIHEGVSRQESRKAAPQAETAEQAALRGEQEQLRCAQQSMASGEPRASSRTAESPDCAQDTGSSRLSPSLLSAEQSEVCGTVAPEEAQTTRTDPRNVSADACGAGRRLCDLQEYDTGQREAPIAVHRSLPSDGPGSGLAVPPVQFGAGIIQGPDGPSCASDSLSEQVIIWCDLNDEQKAAENALRSLGKSYVSLYGSEHIDRRDEELGLWLNGQREGFISKLKMYGSGANLQRCNHMIYAGVGFKFNDFIQGIHRVFRFGQTRPVTIDVIYAETEEAVRRELLAKWQRDDEMKARMSEIIRKYGLNHAAAADQMTRSIGVERKVETGEGWTVALNDCVEEAKLLDADSLDLIVTSIPFSNHYEYTPSYNDFGHTDDDAHFFAQMDFLTPELKRALAPGRLACIHVKDRILFGNVTGEGVPTVNPFHAKCIEHYIRHGFQYLGMIHVNTDVVRENNQTYRLSYSEMLKDGTKIGVGSPEYVLLMRKPQSDRSKGYADRPVMKASDDYSLARWQIDAHAFWRSSGERLAMPDEMELAAEAFAGLPIGKLVKAFTVESRAKVYDFDQHVAIGEIIEGREGSDARGKLPRTFMALAPGATDGNTWDDVVRMRTLNAEQAAKGREKHVCPLQFDIVDRLIERFSNVGELVYDPFCGLGTVPLRALKLDRRGRGSELNPDYWAYSVRYLEEAAREASVPTLFALMGANPGSVNPASNGPATDSAAFDAGEAA